MLMELVCRNNNFMIKKNVSVVHTLHKAKIVLFSTLLPFRNAEKWRHTMLCNCVVLSRDLKDIPTHKSLSILS